MHSGMAALTNTLISLLYALLTVIIIIIALGVMVQVVTPVDALKQIASLVGIALIVTLLVRYLYVLLSGMSFLSYAACAVIAIFLWLWKHNSTKGEK
jgi:hypothetical protein